MEYKQEWCENKAKARLGQDFVKTVLEFAGYKIMDYGIENHNKDIIREISGNYNPDTNIRLMCMPDLVVVDSDTKIAELIEVKYRRRNGYFDEYHCNFWFKFSRIKNYLDYWKDMTIIIVMNIEPYCLCIRMRDVDWCKHFIEKKEGNRKGYTDEIWNFRGIYKRIGEIFPKVTDEHLQKARSIIPINTDNGVSNKE